jgi:uncharacterized membrane protein YedE/YeeE
MSDFKSVAIAAGVGTGFGFLLEKGRVFEPSVIVDQFDFSNITMLKMFLSAVASSMCVQGEGSCFLNFFSFFFLLFFCLCGTLTSVFLLLLLLLPGALSVLSKDTHSKQEDARRKNLEPRNYVATACGGALLGVGMTLCGACPGTVRMHGSSPVPT